MRINYNVSAMLSNNALANNDSLLSKSLERLSSGLKINHAKDNPAGLAMAKRMNAQLVGLSVANQNASDGVSVIETADGALTEVSEMLQRMNELAVKSANGTLTPEDRGVIQDEVDQLKKEITRIAETTEFNGQKLLDGSFDLKGFTGSPDIHVNSYTPDTPEGTYVINSLSVTMGTDGFYQLGAFTPGAGFPADATAEMDNNLLTIKGADGFELSLDMTNATDGKNYQNLSVDVLGIGAMRLQIGANEGQVLAVEIPAISLQNMSIEKLDVSTAEGARDGIGRIDDAMSFISGVRGKLGAYQNRLESTVDSLNVTDESMTAAYSRIMDVDMAEETTQYSTAQVLTQAGTSMLAQANERPSQVLQLLQ